MTTLQIKQAAAEIASRIPALAQDCPTNNAALIEGILERFDNPTVNYDLRLVREPDGALNWED